MSNVIASKSKNNFVVIILMSDSYLRDQFLDWSYKILTLTIFSTTIKQTNFQLDTQRCFFTDI